MKNFKGMTKNEIAIATRHMNAFIENFGDKITIEKSLYDKTFTINSDGRDVQVGIKSIEYVNGWLYGCVQMKNGIVKQD